MGQTEQDKELDMHAWGRLPQLWGESMVLPSAMINWSGEGDPLSGLGQDCPGLWGENTDPPGASWLWRVGHYYGEGIYGLVWEREG